MLLHLMFIFHSHYTSLPFYYVTLDFVCATLSNPVSLMSCVTSILSL